ncbi:MAG: enoyl-CoA hydratase/isomerase family protein [Anaerolineae bacterium]
MTEPIILKKQDKIAVLRVNRPAARNALNWAAQEGFAAAVEQVAGDTAVRLLIITGTGEKAFVAGGDLKELSRHPEPEAGARLNRVMGQALTRLTQLPIPVVAAVNGDAFGGGCEILTACDLRIAAPHARFSFAQAKNGLTTGWGGTSRLAPLLGLSRALELLLTSRLFDAAEAQAMGLIHRIAPDEDVLAAALAWADDILQLPRQALADLKQLAYAAADQPGTAVNQLETALFTNLWTHPDHLEAMAAFVAKRPPNFS